MAGTFAGAGVIYLAEGLTRGCGHLTYLSGCFFAVAWWALLAHLGVGEPQVYVLPPGLALLARGWHCRRQGARQTYGLATVLALAVLFAFSLVQALGDYGHALWLTLEAAMAVAWGVYGRSRTYVTAGGVAILGNALAQLGPAFFELPRWAQSGLTGAILLGGGIVALLKRQELLEARRAFGEHWSKWEV